MIIQGVADNYGSNYDTESAFRPPPLIEKVEYTPPSPFLWVVGCDLGSVNDSTAISVVSVERGYELTNLYRWDGMFAGLKKKSNDLHFVVKHLHRPRLGTSYPAIIDEVKSILSQLPWLGRKPVLVVDATGLGTPVVHQMRKQGLNPIGLTITSGNTATMTGMNWNVTKSLLVGELRLAMHRKRLQVAQGFQARDRLEIELGAFQAKIGDSGRATFQASGTEHDDTVLSLSMAILAGKQCATPSVTLQKLPY
jgi:hypothetical protein